MDKEEAAVDLTRENAHRYMNTYYSFFCKLLLEKDQESSIFVLVVHVYHHWKPENA